jgi:hypothetical protein
MVMGKSQTRNWLIIAPYQQEEQEKKNKVHMQVFIATSLSIKDQSSS